MKKMKKLMLLAVAAIFAVSASAQDFGGWALGPRLGIYTNTGDTVLGIGGVARYRMSEHWRIEPSVMALLHDGCSLDLNCDAHYIFDMGVVRLYPAAGFTVNEIGDWAAGVNLGGGVDFNVANIFEMSAGLKWSPMFHDFRPNPVTVMVSAMFKF